MGSLDQAGVIEIREALRFDERRLQFTGAAGDPARVLHVAQAGAWALVCAA